jgi:DNA-binding YbaB/EbfC family protein
MNIASMMQQAQKMQKKLQEAQEELSKMELTGTSGDGAVTVTCTGQAKIKSVKIYPKAINPENPSSVDTETVEILEDLILQAINAATEKASAQNETKMKAVTGGIKIPGLSFGK